MGKSIVSGVMVGAALIAATPVTAQIDALNGKSNVIDPGAVISLAAAINSALSRLPAGASQSDAEAAIVYAIDQSGQSGAVVLQSLDSINQVGLSPVAVSALGSVRATRSRLAQRGTGSIAGGPSISIAFGPALSVTGGSSDYVRR